MRALNEHERNEIAPIAQEYLEAKAEFERAQTNLTRVLRLIEPAFAEERVEFLLKEMRFVEKVVSVGEDKSVD